MSLFAAMNSAIGGLTAQSNAFGDISDNVANSQTVGFKRVDTSFVDFLTTSTATRNDPGAVVARPSYVNDVQRTITQTDSPLSLAIAGRDRLGRAGGNQCRRQPRRKFGRKLQRRYRHGVSPVDRRARAYPANTKVVTTANDVLEATISMKQ